MEKISLGTKKPKIHQVIFYKSLPKQPQKYQAQLIISNNSYILLKGSYINKFPSQAFQKNHHYYKNWLNIINTQSKQDLKNPNCYITTKDISFSSPSYAGAMVNARSTNGRIEWKLKDGTSLHEYEQNISLKNK